MTYVLHRSLHDAPVIAASAVGDRIVDEAGKVYLDSCGGAAVSLFGHANRRLIDAAVSQLEALDYVHSSFFSSRAYEQLAKALVEASRGAFTHALALSGGSEAVETALKLARQYFLERDQPQRNRFITRRQSYHGNTIGALSVSQNRRRRDDFRPLLFEVSSIAECNFYRNGRPGETEEQYGQRLAEELEQEIARHPPGSVIGFVAETVGGATSGAMTPPPGYFRRVADICARHGILLILDEIMCGMGRTGWLFAFEAEGVRPDIAICGKALGGGVQPVSAVLLADHVVDAIALGSGALRGGHTFMGHPAACAVAVEALAILTGDGFLEGVRSAGKAFETLLRTQLSGQPNVGDIRGRGLFWAVELVADRASKKPFAPAHRLNDLVKRNAFARGLLVYPGGGTADGIGGDHILLAPSATAGPDELSEMVSRLRGAIDDAVAGLQAATQAEAPDTVASP